MVVLLTVVAVANGFGPYGSHSSAGFWTRQTSPKRFLNTNNTTANKQHLSDRAVVIHNNSFK